MVPSNHWGCRLISRAAGQHDRLEQSWPAATLERYTPLQPCELLLSARPCKHCPGRPALAARCICRLRQRLP